MTVRKLKNSWWVDFRADYVRYRRRSPENSRAGAMAFEAMLRHKLARGERIDRITDVSLAEQSFEQFAWRWFNAYVVANNKPSEQRNKEIVLRASLVPFFGEMAIGAISSWHIERYKTALLGSDLARKTMNNRLTVLRKCLSAAYEWLELTGKPPTIVWFKCPPVTTDYLAPDECAALLAHARGITYEMALAALRTGMRQGELRGLQWPSIDWQTHTITVRHSRCDYSRQLVSPKSNRVRYIPMDAELHDILLSRRQATGYVFPDVNGEPLTGRCIAHRLAVLCKQAGLRKMGWHSLRHTFASHLAMKGVPLNAVQALLGHSTITTTMRYAHLAPSTLRRAIEMLGPTANAPANFGQPAGNEWVDTAKRERLPSKAGPENTAQPQG